MKNLCVLHSTTRGAKPNQYVPSKFSIYSERTFCMGNSSCFKEFVNYYFPGGRKRQIRATSIASCKMECLKAKSFYCRYKIFKKSEKKMKKKIYLKMFDN